MKTFEKNVLRPELKYTNQSFISPICFAKTIFCLILVLFFSEDQFLDIFHKELERKKRKTKWNEELFVYDMKMHGIIISFQSTIYRFGYSSKWRRLPGYFYLNFHQSPIYNSTMATEFMDSYINTYTFLFYLDSHIQNLVCVCGWEQD